MPDDATTPEDPRSSGRTTPTSTAECDEVKKQLECLKEAVSELGLDPQKLIEAACGIDKRETDEAATVMPDPRDCKKSSKCCCRCCTSPSGGQLQNIVTPRRIRNRPTQLHSILKPTVEMKNLGSLIFEENPYTREAATMLVQIAGQQGINAFLPDGDGPWVRRMQDALSEAHKQVPMELVLESDELESQVEAERDYQESQWTFKGGNYRVARALRVPYCFRDAYGRMVEEHILIGYEGSGGYG